MGRCGAGSAPRETGEANSAAQEPTERAAARAQWWVPSGGCPVRPGGLPDGWLPALAWKQVLRVDRRLPIPPDVRTAKPAGIRARSRSGSV